MRWLLRLFACVFLLAVCMCTTVRKETVESQLAQRHAEFLLPPGLPITGYTDARGTYHPMRGFVRVLGRDSLEFSVIGDRFDRYTADAVIPASDAVHEWFVIATDSVQTISVKSLSEARTAILVVTAAAVTAAIIAASTERKKKPAPTGPECDMWQDV